MKKTWVQGGLILGMALSATTAFASPENDNRNLLIEKLNKVQSQLAPNDPSKVAVTLRLADLYAERARVESMRELENGCTVCNGGEADRKKALRYYLEVMDRTPEASQGKVMIQIGHLYEMTGSEDKAIQFYKQVLAGKPSAGLHAEANLSLGEIYFKRRDHEKALSHYQEVLKNPSASSKGLAAYRSAWCSFNQGRIDSAIEQIQQVLKTPALLSRSGAPGAPVDPQFHEEVSRDLVTFLSKEKFQAAQMKTLFDLSPEKIRNQNVQTLALEYERLGQKTEALQVWKFIFSYLNRPEDRLSAQISMAQLEFDSGRRVDALSNYEKAMQAWKESKSCGTENCEELRKRSRQFVVTWNQLEKKQVTPELLTAYQLYSATFPDDVDMKVYAGKVAEDLKDYKAAYTQNESAIGLLKGKTAEADKLEALLLKQIEIAEVSKNDELLVVAADSYLTNSLKKTKTFEVQYQKARHQYEKGNYPVAVEELKSLALSKSGSEALRKQAADLSLDGLVLMKDEARLAVWAKEYAAAFKNSSQDFSQIVQKSILTKSAAVGESNLEVAYRELAQFNPQEAAAEDSIKYYKNKLILAQKLKKYSEAQAAADSLLAQNGLSVEDREFAWGRKAYLSELLLDFQSAMAATEKLEKALNPEEKALKVAIFAELSGSQSETYYQKYLKVSRDEEQKRLVAAELVRKAKSPAKELEAQKAVLEKSPALYATLIAEVYAKTPSESLLKLVQKDEKLKSTEAGKLLTRISFLAKFNELKKKLVVMQLDTGNDRKLAQSIKARAAQLTQLEALAQTAIQSGDWTSQLVSLSLVGQESERFYNELMSAPMPAGLQGEEEQQYLNLLSTQAAPFQSKAAAAKVKAEEFWANPNWQTALEQAWKQIPMQPLLAVEVTALKEIAPEKSKKSLEALTVATAVEKTRPAMQAVLEARQKVHKNPFDRQAIEDLLNIEKKSENMAMVQYLQNRLSNLNKEVQ